MGFFGNLGQGLAVLGPVLGPYGTALAAIGSVAATLDADDQSGFVVLPQGYPWGPYGLLWGVSPTKDWSDFLVDRVGQVDQHGVMRRIPFDEPPLLERVTPALAASLHKGDRASLEGTWDTRLLFEGIDVGVNAARRRGSSQRARDTATLTTIRSTQPGQGEQAQRTQLGHNPFGSGDFITSAIKKWAPPFGGEVAPAVELLNRWASRMQQQELPNFADYLDNRGWLDNQWHIGGGSQTWEEHVPLGLGAHAAASSIGVPTISRTDWIQHDPHGYRAAWAAKMNADMQLWAADADAWHTWRFEAKVTLAQDTATKEITQAFESAVSDAINAGLDENAAMQHALTALAAQIGGQAIPQASPDPAIAHAQAQEAYGPAVEEIVMQAANDQGHVTATTPPAGPKLTSKSISPTGIAAAAGLLAVGVLLAR